MPHRDELEAAHARIAALEGELSEVRADADRSRGRAEELERSAATAAAPKEAPKAKKAKTKRKRKRDRAAKQADVATPATEAWTDRQRFRTGVALLAACAYGAAAVALLLSQSELPSPYVLLGPVVAMAVGVGILGVVLRAPGAFGGAMITLLISAMELGALGIGASDAMVGELLAEGAGRYVVRVLASAVAVTLGVVISARWVPDAASSPVEGD
jgi:hypothetical protein